MKEYTAELDISMRMGVGTKGEYVYWGYIYNDKRKRFRNGDNVRTSLVDREEEIDGERYIITQNSVYKVKKK